MLPPNNSKHSRCRWLDTFIMKKMAKESRRNLIRPRSNGVPNGPCFRQMVPKSGNHWRRQWQIARGHLRGSCWKWRRRQVRIGLLWQYCMNDLCERHRGYRCPSSKTNAVCAWPLPPHTTARTCSPRLSANRHFRQSLLFLVIFVLQLFGPKIIFVIFDHFLTVETCKNSPLLFFVFFLCCGTVFADVWLRLWVLQTSDDSCVSTGLAYSSFRYHSFHLIIISTPSSPQE